MARHELLADEVGDRGGVGGRRPGRSKATGPWTGVRNYQARNFMRDGMRSATACCSNHSSCAEPGIVGIARVASTPYPDRRSSNRKSPSTTRLQAGRAALVLVDVAGAEEDAQPGPARAARGSPARGLLVLKKGNRLSITPVDPVHWRRILKLLDAPA
jgi:predicted RNA-binding protein with PUA-like domain